MNRYCKTWIEEWCHENGWTDPFMEHQDYWAFPPHAVMPIPIPHQVLQMIKARKGMSPDERLWSSAAWFSAAFGIAFTCVLHSPMPLITAFAVCAIAVAQFEDD